MEFLLICNLPLDKTTFAELEKANIDYYLDEEGLVFSTREDLEKATEIVNANKGGN